MKNWNIIIGPFYIKKEYATCHVLFCMSEIDLKYDLS